MLEVLIESPVEKKTRELLVPRQPETIILPTLEDVDQLAAQYVIEQVQIKPDSVLVLLTGNTPIGMYSIIAQAYREHAVNFNRTRVFNLDEYYTLPPGHLDGYERYMKEYFCDHTNVRPDMRHIPRSYTDDPNEEAALYEKLLQQYGPPDLAIVGIGPKLTCHIGFNETGSSVDSRTRLVKLREDTIAKNRNHFTKPNDMPRTALTMGIANILEAKRVILIAKGEHKAGGIQRTLEGIIGPEAPASFLRYHTPKHNFYNRHCRSEFIDK